MSEQKQKTFLTLAQAMACIDRVEKGVTGNHFTDWVQAKLLPSWSWGQQKALVSRVHKNQNGYYEMIWDKETTERYRAIAVNPGRGQFRDDAHRLEYMAMVDTTDDKQKVRDELGFESTTYNRCKSALRGEFTRSNNNYDWGALAERYYKSKGNGRPAGDQIALAQAALPSPGVTRREDGRAYKHKDVWALWDLLEAQMHEAFMALFSEDAVEEDER